MSRFEDDSAGYLINHLARIFAAGLQAEIKPLGLSTGVFPVMVQLWQKDGLSQSELVKRVAVEQATMAKTLARMKRDGLIVIRPDDNDARMKRAWLSETGRALRDPAQTSARALNATMLASLDEAESETFLNLMRRLVAANQSRC